MSRSDSYLSQTFNPANYVVRMLLLYLIETFKFNSDTGFSVVSEDNLGDPQNLSGLLITDQNTWETVYKGHLPSIVLRRGIVSFGGNIQSGDMSRVLESGTGLGTTVLEIVSVPVVFSCMARQDTEAEMLAFLVSCYLHDDKRWAKAFGFYGIQSPQISSVDPYNPQTPSFICSTSTMVSTTRKYFAKLLPEKKLEEVRLLFGNNGIANIT